MRVRAGSRHGKMKRSDRVEEVPVDLLHYESVSRAVDGVDAAVHCAAALSSDESVCQAVNVRGTANLVAALIAAKCRLLVHISSISVYDLPANMTVGEDCPLLSDSSASYPYGRSKADAERLVSASGLAFVILRPAPVLSMHPTSFWGPLSLERARASRWPLFALPEFPFVHADNLAQAVLLALCSEKAVGKAYNVVDGHADTRDYLTAVAEAVGQAPPSLNPNALGMQVAGERARRDLGYSPPDRFQEFLIALRNHEVQR
jgi:nucleoside-diphosphate-sugar epimerase